MTKYGLVASGGGYRSFYTAGVLVWLKRQDIPVVHLTSTSSGNNIVLDYLLWNWDEEELPPVLTKTIRLNPKDIFDVFSNFIGLKPVLIPNGSYLFEVRKGRTRKSLQLDDLKRRSLLSKHLKTVRWDIATTNMSERRSQCFNVNELLSEMSGASLSRFMDVFIAGITTIPYFKAKNLDDQYFLEGGYTDNTPLRTLFEDPNVEEIIAVDFTNYDYHAALNNLYSKKRALFIPLNSIDMNLLVSDLQWCLPNMAVVSQAVFINQMLETLGQTSVEIAGKTYYHKPLHVLRPRNLESMTISLKDVKAQKKYFKLGMQEIERLFATTPTPQTAESNEKETENLA